MDDDAVMILLVEDHQPTRGFLAENLAADGYDLLEADSVVQAEDLIEATAPDLAIIDLGLPDRDGLDLVAHIRDGEAVAGRIDPELPILVLTGRGSEIDRLRGFERGCDDYLVKPFSYQELRARIAALLRRTRQRPQAGRL
ncbi:MAG TPA: response regulator transcription factor [Solirubrobacteraceae bacterium]|nr:response regulator transcription factor [Solirubrobacteraceae bacterium]